MEHNIKYFLPLGILQFLGPPAYKKNSSLPPHTPKTSSTSAWFFYFEREFYREYCSTISLQCTPPF